MCKNEACRRDQLGPRLKPTASGSLVDKYANFIRAESKDATARIAEDFCVSLEEQEKILKEIQEAQKEHQGASSALPSKSSHGKSSPPETKCR